MSLLVIGNRIGLDVMVSLIAWDVVNRGFELLSVQTTDYDIVICQFSVKHAVLRSKSTDWLAQNQDNVPWWGNMSTCGLLSQ
jgi:hypothetical protein